jgi:hypothetical protein
LTGRGINEYNFTFCFVWVLNLVSYLKERALKVFENGVLRRMFGPKREGFTGD